MAGFSITQNLERQASSGYPDKIVVIRHDRLAIVEGRDCDPVVVFTQPLALGGKRALKAAGEIGDLRLERNHPVTGEEATRVALVAGSGREFAEGDDADVRCRAAVGMRERQRRTKLPLGELLFEVDQVARVKKQGRAGSPARGNAAAGVAGGGTRRAPRVRKPPCPQTPLAAPEGRKNFPPAAARLHA